MSTPDCTPPESYTIGGKDTAPFVSVPQLKGHLALLRAFVDLKSKVEKLTQREIHDKYPSLPAVVDEWDEKRWICFVKLAAER